jgi:hypothetical protein
VKLAITVAMHAGTLAKLPQLGAPGSVGLEKLGFVPEVLVGPKENPLLFTDPLLFPAELYPYSEYT